MLVRQVLEIWFKIKTQQESKGEAYLIRYADDFVACFEREEEAREYYEKLKERITLVKTIKDGKETIHYEGLSSPLEFDK